MSAVARPAAAALAIAAAVPTPAAAGADGSDGWRVEAGALADASRWDERNERGTTLLVERGTLAGATLAASRRLDAAFVGPIELRVAWRHLRGRRDYDGRTTTGAPLATAARIADDTFGVQAWRPLGGQGWRLGARIDARSIDRRLAGVGAVAGADETHRSARVGLGVGWEAHAAAPLELGVDAWAGGGPPGRMRLAVGGYDAATLPLGAGAFAEVAARAGWRVADGVVVRADLGASAERVGAGDARVLNRAGAPAGAARQPETRRRDATFGLTLSLALR